MTDPDTQAAFYANRARIRASAPSTIEEAVLEHVEKRIDLTLPPSDAEVFDGVPTDLPDEITARIDRTNGNDDDWEGDDQKTGVHPIIDRLEKPVATMPFDPTFCTM